MALSLFFSKVKALGPVAVVGISVAVTINLLTKQTPLNQEVFKVNAEEDISTETYEDLIEMPKPPEPELEETPPEPPAPQEVEEDPKENAESNEVESEGDSQKEREEEKDGKQNQEQPKQKARGWKSETNNRLIGVFKKLLTPKKK